MNTKTNEMERIYGPQYFGKTVLSYILTQPQPFWTKINYDGKTYIMTFEYNIYECKEKSNG